MKEAIDIEKDAPQELPPEVVKQIFEEQNEFRDNVFKYELNDVLKEVERPLTLKEKRSLKDFDLEQVDTLENFDDLLLRLAKLRDINEDTLDNQPYSDLCIWVRKVIYSTLNLRHAVKK